MTRTGSFAGSVDYVAPEEIRGDDDVDGRADVYSLGCVLYRCLTGEVAFPRDSELVTIYAHLEDPPPRPSDARSDLPPAMDGVIARALAKSREQRYATCMDLARAAADAIGATSHAPRTKRTNRRPSPEGARVAGRTPERNADPSLRRGRRRCSAPRGARSDAGRFRHPGASNAISDAAAVPPYARDGGHRRGRRDRVRVRTPRARPRQLPVRRNRPTGPSGGPQRRARARGQSVRDRQLSGLRHLLRPLVGAVAIDHGARPRRPRIRPGSVVAADGVLRVLRRACDGSGRARVPELQPPRGLYVPRSPVLALHRAQLRAVRDVGRMWPCRGWCRGRTWEHDVSVAQARSRDLSEREVPMHPGVLASPAVLVLDGDAADARGAAAVGPALCRARGRRTQRERAQLSTVGTDERARAGGSEARDPRVRRRNGGREEGQLGDRAPGRADSPQRRTRRSACSG